MPQKLVRHIIVIWDECEHLSARNIQPKAGAFVGGLEKAFPEIHSAAVTVMPASTRSPMLGHLGIRTFLHEGDFVGHSGANKDLAIVKYCVTGLVDQDERYYFLLDDIRDRLLVQGEPPLDGNDACLVAFITTDHDCGMTAALAKIAGASNHRVSYMLLRGVGELGSGTERMSAFGDILGRGLRESLLGVREGALVLGMPDAHPAQPSFPPASCSCHAMETPFYADEAHDVERLGATNHTRSE